MEGLMTFTGVVMIVFGILQIILFFKVWGMTNDIKELKNELISIPDKWTLNKAILKGDKRKIEEILFNAMFICIKNAFDDSHSNLDGSNATFVERIAAIKKEYKEKYIKYGIVFPSAVDKIEAWEDIDNL